MSKSVLDRLTAVPDHNDEPVYEEPAIRSVATHVIALAGGGLLAVCEPQGTEGTWTEFAVFRFASGPATVNGVEVSPACYEPVFHGSGPAGFLREMRHTYWGEPSNSGYIFYPPGALIADAFVKLKRWFDCD